MANAQSDLPGDSTGAKSVIYNYLLLFEIKMLFTTTMSQNVIKKLLHNITKVFIVQCTIVQSVVLRSHVVCPSVCLSVCLSVCDVGGS